MRPLYKAAVIVAAGCVSACGPTCVMSSTYSLGKLDPRFNISPEKATSIIEQAALAWNAGTGHSLLSHKGTGGELTVHFTFGDAQEAITKSESLRTDYRHALALHEKRRAHFDVRRAAYSEAVRRYNEDRARVSERAGQSTMARGDFADRATRLRVEQIELENELRDLNAMAEELTRKASALNAVRSSDDLGRFTSWWFGFGLISGREISVNAFSNERDLLHLLEHEFGHSFGLGHIEYPSAIMYYQTDADASVAPTQADLAEWSRVCGGR